MTTVTVTRGQLNARGNIVSKGKPYVIIRSHGGEIRTNIGDSHEAPSWNEFPVPVGQDNQVIVEVWDKHSMTKDECIGETTINVQSALANGMTAAWHPIYFHGKQTGQLYVDIEQKKAPQAPSGYGIPEGYGAPTGPTHGAFPPQGPTHNAFPPQGPRH